MPVKNYNPTSPARRQMTSSDYSGLTKKAPEKQLQAAPPPRDENGLPAAVAPPQPPLLSHEVDLTVASFPLPPTVRF